MFTLPGKKEKRLGKAAFFYEDYGKEDKYIQLGTGVDVPGSAHSAVLEQGRMRWDSNVTVKDFSVSIPVGATCTGATTNAQNVSFYLGKILGGTGALAYVGTASFHTLADSRTVAGVCAETNFVAGDEMVFGCMIGTHLGDNSASCALCTVRYVERFVA